MPLTCFAGGHYKCGGWVNEGGAADAVLGVCVFPDMSSIDSWGLAYNAAGVIRGIDLATVLRFRPEETGNASQRPAVQRVALGVLAEELAYLDLYTADRFARTSSGRSGGRS